MGELLLATTALRVNMAQHTRLYCIQIMPRQIPQLPMAVVRMVIRLILAIMHAYLILLAMDIG